LTIGSPESVVKANHIGLPNAWHPVTAKLIDSIRYGAGITDVIAQNNAQFWIEHDTAQSDRRRFSPNYYQ
jgi:hypothetical protein